MGSNCRQIHFSEEERILLSFLKKQTNKTNKQKKKQASQDTIYHQEESGNFQGKNLIPKMNSAKKCELKLIQLFVRLQ